MRKVLKLVCCLITILVLFYFGTLLADKLALRSDLIRLHVVANSDSAYDQNMKIVVKDAVLDYLQDRMNGADNADEALEYLHTHLNDIAVVARNSLVDLDEDVKISVSIGEKSFSRRDYENFSLPAGIYNALQVRIGDAEGRNWWCVVFPSLCLPTSVEAFTETAAMAGMGDGLVSSLAGEKPYEIRFYLLDCLGRLENLVFGK